MVKTSRKTQLISKNKPQKSILVALIFVTTIIGLVVLLRGLAASTFAPYSLYTYYYRQEPVTFGVRNNGTKKLVLSSATPWRIKDSNKNDIYTPLSAQTVVTVGPGKTHEWQWDQKDNNKKYVKAGTYTVTFNDSANSLKLRVNSTLGSSGYFTFLGRRDLKTETIRAYFSKPQTVRLAIENYYKKNEFHPHGKLIDDRPGKSPFDNKWSWHWDPAQTVMTEASQEGCDGRPREDVEENLDYWLKVGDYCPWYTGVTALE